MRARQPQKAREKEILYIDPHQIYFDEFDAAISPGYRFDYQENGLRVTVEVERVVRRELVELTLRVVDDLYSRPTPPRLGDRFRVSYRQDAGLFYAWLPWAEGHFARYAAWRRENADE